jgi:nitrite reductase/ring-hydroxylating ferredoxin subunit
VGLLHGLVNVSATTLYAISLMARLRGARRTGRLTALLGYGLVTLGGYLGGDLSYKYHLGADHSPEEAPPSDFVPVLAEADLPEGSMRQVMAGTVPVMLARQDGRVYALANTCSHLGGPLAEGALEPGCVTCPWHGSQFALEDGRVVNGPATFPQPAYETRIRNGQIEVSGKSDAI